MAGKPIRLGKAAGELNVGIPTIVEFLGSKGIVIDPSPTSRLEPEHYSILCQEFAADQSMKEQSKAALRREKRESLSLKDKSSEEPIEAPIVDDEDEEEINLEEIKRQVLNENVPKSPATNDAPEVSAPSVPDQTSAENKLNVIGKIDLDALNQKTRPDKRKAAPEQNDENSTEQKPANVASVTPEVKEEPAQAATPEIPEKAPEIETIRVTRQALTGPTVLGKIELPVEKPRTPVASSSDDANSKRKRKRIKKLNRVIRQTTTINLK